MNNWLYLIGSIAKYPQGIFEALANSDLGNIVVEAGNITLDQFDADEDGRRDDYILGSPRLERAEVASLTGQSIEGAPRVLLPYVNVALPDFNRYFWNADWVTPAASDPQDLDYGTINSAAPDWLKNNLGLATGDEYGPNGSGDDVFGYIVDYTDPAWQDIVITQSIAYIEHGYSGLFLDDVGRYFITSLPTWQAAEEMMRFVLRIEDEVTQATGISKDDLQITINGGIYLLSDYIYADGGAPQPDFALMEGFRSAVDGLMSESLTLDATPYWEVAQEWFGDGDTGGFPLGPDETDLIAIETPKNWTEMAEIQDELTPLGVTLVLARTTEYSDLLNTPLIGTESSEVIEGSELAEAIFGRGGEDTLYGFGGDDIIYASAEGSRILGGQGDDLIIGGPGDDVIFAGRGNDTIIGGGGKDIIFRGAGADEVYASFDDIGQALALLQAGNLPAGEDLILL